MVLDGEVEDLRSLRSQAHADQLHTLPHWTWIAARESAVKKSGDGPRIRRRVESTGPYQRRQMTTLRGVDGEVCARE
jgi:hypothetical protein